MINYDQEREKTQITINRYEKMNITSDLSDIREREYYEQLYTKT